MQTLPVQTILGYPFSGPVPLAQAPDQFRFWSGVYLISRVAFSGETALDVGESEDIGERIGSHDRRWCWDRHAAGSPIVVYAHIQSDLVRRLVVERDLRQQLRPPCGLR